MQLPSQALASFQALWGRKHEYAKWNIETRVTAIAKIHWSPTSYVNRHTDINKHAHRKLIEGWSHCMDYIL